MVERTHVPSHAEALFWKRWQTHLEHQSHKSRQQILFSHFRSSSSRAGLFTIIVTASLPLLRGGSSIKKATIHRLLRAEVWPTLRGIVTMMMCGSNDCNGAAQCWHREMWSGCSGDLDCWGKTISILWPVHSIMIKLQLSRISFCKQTKKQCFSTSSHCCSILSKYLIYIVWAASTTGMCQNVYVSANLSLFTVMKS